MFKSAINIKMIDQFQNLEEATTALVSREDVASGLDLLSQKSLIQFRSRATSDQPLQVQMHWVDPRENKLASVLIKEIELYGDLKFNCELCTLNGRLVTSCAHQVASFFSLWSVLKNQEELFPANQDRLKDLAEKLNQSDRVFKFEENQSQFSSVQLESISLVLTDHPLFEAHLPEAFLTTSIDQYKKQNLPKSDEVLSPRLWSLPEIFRRQPGAFAKNQFREVELLNQLTDCVRYNFSHGLQVNAREILKHPLHKTIPQELLPKAIDVNPFQLWNFNFLEKQSLSQNVLDVKMVMQTLVVQILTHFKRCEVHVDLQSKERTDYAFRLKEASFSPSEFFEWRTDLLESGGAHLKLINKNRSEILFFSQYAVDLKNGIVHLFSWKNYFDQLEFFLLYLKQVDKTKLLSTNPEFHCLDDSDLRTLLQFLRAKSIPLHLSQGQHAISFDRSQLQIYFQTDGTFVLKQFARVQGEKDQYKIGWGLGPMKWMRVMSEGIAFLFDADPKDLASSSLLKRDWDLKLLKHVGIAQYVVYETLNYYFVGELSDGQSVEKNQIFSRIKNQIQSFLVSPTDVQSRQSLDEICSRSVLVCFEETIEKLLASLTEDEFLYTTAGEIKLEKAIEREYRVLFEMLKSLVISSKADCFRKSRMTFFERVFLDETTHLSIDAHQKPMGFPRVTQKDHRLFTAIELLQEQLHHGIKIFYNNEPLQELSEGEFHVDFHVQTERDKNNFNWFELNPQFFLFGQEVDSSHFLSLGTGGVVEYKNKLYLVPKKQVPSLRRLEVFWQNLQKGKTDTKKRISFSDRVFQLPKHHILELLALRYSGISVEGDEEWKRICDFYDQLGSGNRSYQASERTQSFLKPYQLTGARWLDDLYRLRLGALLADDMGLGKTLQTLSFLDKLREEKQLKKVLVVVPSSLVYNWQSEVQKFTPDLPLEVFQTKERDRLYQQLKQESPLVMITTYGLLMEHDMFFQSFPWQILIFDEAQNLKNLTTKRTSVARSLSADFKIALTGTPMENHFGEFFSIIDLLVPGSLGSIENFRKEFVHAQTIRREQIEDLKLKIRPLVLRRHKKEILEQLPDKIETKISIDFEEDQKKIYRDIALSYNERIQEVFNQKESTSLALAQAQLQMLTALLRLRQVCSDPSALPQVKYDKVPPKLSTLVESLEEIVSSGESALVFTQFLQTLQHAEKLLKKMNIPVFVLHGSLSTKQRQNLLKEFNESTQGAVLVMTLKTGGVGLNLTKASYVFHLEPWWNPAVENQATDRAHRLGQTRNVQVFRYIMHESLEEKMELLKERKDRKFQSLFSQTEKATEIDTGQSQISKDDFEFLLGIKSDS